MTEPKRRTEFLVPNFTYADELTFYGANHPTCGPMVTLKQYSGSLNFQHDMTPEQARKFAADLLLAADEAENETPDTIVIG